MADYKKYINALRKCAKEHEKDITFAGQIVVTNLCRDTAKLLEGLKQVVTPQKQEWISVSEELPKANEYIGDVAKYYLVQDEYGDMLVARYCGGYWEEIHQLQPITDEIVAWRELPKSYKAENEVEDIYCDRNLCMCYECENCPVNKEKEK